MTSNSFNDKKSCLAMVIFFFFVSNGLAEEKEEKEEEEFSRLGSTILNIILTLVIFFVVGRVRNCEKI